MNTNLRQQIENLTQSHSYKELSDFVENHVELLLSTPEISQLYNLLRTVDISAAKRPLPKLITAWMAFLCGDYAVLFELISNLCPIDLSNSRESSLFYALKALIANITDANEGLKYARLSIDVLPKSDTSFFMANAKLTNAQLLANSTQHRLAADLFAEAFQLFHSNGFAFPAVVSVINEAINRYYLGQFSKVIDRCNEALMIGSSFVGKTQFFWNAVHLPLGMCYFQLNKLHLAVRHLQLAKTCIDRFELLHMHGLAELYLFKSYFLLQDRAGLERLSNEINIKFKHIHNKNLDYLQSMFRILSVPAGDLESARVDIEKFELEYSRNRENTSSIVIETLVYLQRQGHTGVVTTEDLNKILKHLRYSGSVPSIQQTLIQLAELYYLQEKYSQAATCIEEAVELYQEFGICSCFYFLPLRTLECIEPTSPDLYHGLKARFTAESESAGDGKPLLTTREREIMTLVAQGKTNAEISRALFITVGTIKWHINNIFGKLEVSNRIQAVAKARRLQEI